ncbi:DUF1127 domain-containing protein [Bradyrhizobium sp. CCGUVB1N3]|uniref:DUF1127 domain-containing protein n=1 Tax=Bradyrhizobium sp. CCGUVB1N3 TaxID=2949629 RepID=UPI0020B35B31|nr:DUF1127 domain-containing protein [Bradyrhizobium sp. CCGUVB1N3]MCP3471563.1 DUF1127 domain-containing protein [Bradyrhizobium sp. CCGUVB1N3]
MSTTYSATRLDRRLASARRVVRFLERHWEAFQERRKRARRRDALFDLGDRELTDIGISRGEIDYVASNPNIDPRGVRSIPSTMF